MYLALDQSIRITGWSIYDDRGKLKECGKWTIPSDLPIGARLERFISYLNDLSENYNINKVFFEDIQMQNGNVETYKKLAYTQAMILYWCEIHNKECEILSPSHWRAVLKQEYKINFGRQRKEQKQAALCFVKEHFGKEVTEDEADAICLGLAGIITKDIKESAF